ncbi:MAG: ABC transporter substrate-binding protein [Roseibium sp.]|uniref:ABC transporter substrate-binding protein n=1 Tax=Roseibium sp. TaxID=1936156 RepID=UPI003D9C1D62
MTVFPSARTLLATVLLAGTATAPAFALDEVTYGTNWLAQAEHGGFYQSVADGTYEKYGLKVTIAPGGPQAANDALLISGKIDFYMGGALKGFDYVKEGIPFINVASMFQKDPQILTAHPDQGIEKFTDLTKLETIFMGKDGYVTYFEWMKKNFDGFTDAQYKPYTFNPAPFIVDPKSAQQGYLTSEPYEIEKQAGWTPKVFLLADEGWTPYSTMITTSKALVDENPDLVQRFVDASIEGWYNYLYGDNAAANELIKKDNPEMTDGQLAYSLAKMKEYGIVDSGDTLENGIGCMTDAHYKTFFDTLSSIGVVDASLDYTQSYTLEFVCKGVGLDLKK